MTMKLHDVVELQQELKTLVPTQAIEKELNSIINNISNVQDRYGEEYAYRLGLVIAALNDVKKSLEAPLEQVALINDIVELDHRDATEKFSLPSYQGELHYQNPDRIREVRQLYIPNGADEIVSQAIDLYVDWRYPGLEIGCRDGHWTKYMVGCDPLYVVDVFQEFLDSTKAGYPEEYQQRLRSYLIKDHNLSALPQDQFGFVFSWNYFNCFKLL